MAFNPNGYYLSCVDIEGKVYAWQNGSFYDKYGDVFNSLPQSNRGQLMVSSPPLAQSGVASSVTGTTAETTLASIIIPGGMMGPNGVMRVSMVWSHTNSINNKTMKLVFGGSVFVTDVETTVGSFTSIISIRNRGAQNSQVMGAGAGWGGTGNTGSNAVTGTIDTSVNQVMTLTGQLALGTETITLEGYTVEILPS